jgi:uncharacterized protein YlxW (UPF0749 family)
MTSLADRVRRIPSWQLTLGLALLALGFLIAAQLRSEAPRVRYTSQERPPLVETALDLQAKQDQLKARILELRAQIQDLEQKGQGNAAAVRQMNADLDAARLAAGLVSLQGTGVVFQLQDSTNATQPGENATDFFVSAADIRVLVEELWLAGAEGVAVNEERVTTGTAILDIGGSVLVNSAYLAPPYQVAAIGPSDLYAQLSQAQGFRDFVRARAEAFGIRISYAELSDVVLPAYAGTVNLRYARPVPSPTVLPTATSAPATTAPTTTTPAASPRVTPKPATKPSPNPSPRPTTRPARTPRPT